MTEAQSASFLRMNFYIRATGFVSAVSLLYLVLISAPFVFFFLFHPQMPQDSPEQEASKSPRGAVPVSTEASLPPEATPQLSLQSTTPIANYSQVSHKVRSLIVRGGQKKRVESARMEKQSGKKRGES